MNKKILLTAALVASAAFADIMWDGTAYDYEVDTGLDDGTGTSGIWYYYNDHGDGGSSVLEWTAGELGNEYSDDAFDGVIDACGGICFTVTLKSGYDYPYVGVAFNVTGQNQIGGDVTDWGGIDVAYSSTAKFTLELAVEDEATVTEYNNYTVTLTSTNGATSTKSAAWTDFSQESGWG